MRWQQPLCSRTCYPVCRFITTKCMLIDDMIVLMAIFCNVPLDILVVCYGIGDCDVVNLVIDQYLSCVGLSK